MTPDATELRNVLLAGSPGPVTRKLIDLDGYYLFKAYTRIEQFWHERVDRISPVHLVVLSEAPLFGDAEVYFYNPRAKITTFFNYAGYEEAFVGIGPTVRRTGSKAVDKCALLDALGSLGVVIVDAFPFALNENTSATYGALSENEYQQLFLDTAPHYFRPKLAEIATRMSSNATLVFRLARLSDACGNLVEQEMALAGLEGRRLARNHISLRYGNLDSQRLRALYQKAISGG